MANEVTVQTVLNIRKNNFVYESTKQRTSDATGYKGPTPGALTVTADGIDVDLSELTTPGLCRLTHVGNDGSEAVEYGAWNGVEFIPIGELWAGDSFVLRLSRMLGSSYGTGTAVVDTDNVIRMRVMNGGADQVVNVEAFEK